MYSKQVSKYNVVFILIFNRVKEVNYFTYVHAKSWSKQPDVNTCYLEKMTQQLPSLNGIWTHGLWM